MRGGWGDDRSNSGRVGRMQWVKKERKKDEGRGGKRKRVREGKGGKGIR